MNKKKLIIRISLLFILIGIGLFSLIIYNEVLKPSYYSVASVCFEDAEEILEEAGLVIAGRTTYNRTSEELNVTLYVDDPEIKRHELVHVSQIQRGFPIANCDHIFQMYLAENEAYTMQNLPDKLFYLIY